MFHLSFQEESQGNAQEEDHWGYGKKRVSLADQIPKGISCSPDGFLTLKDKLRHIKIFKVYLSKNQLELGSIQSNG